MSEITSSWEPDKDKLYSELCSNIRATDDISFKLLGFVPLLSGSAIIFLLFNSNVLEPASVAMLCIAGAVITFGLFCWERRNIKTCKLFRDAASELEKKLPQEWLRPYSILATKTPPDKYYTILGKTGSEAIIYVTSILVWLIPVINLVVKKYR